MLDLEFNEEISKTKSKRGKLQHYYTLFDCNITKVFLQKLSDLLLVPSWKMIEL